MALKRTVCVLARGTGLVAQYEAVEGADGGNITIRRPEPASPCLASVKTDAPCHFISCNTSGRLVASFGPCDKSILLLHCSLLPLRSNSMSLKKLPKLDIPLSMDDSIVWIGWHPASFSDNHLAVLSLHGQLLMYRIRGERYSQELSTTVHSPIDYSLRCRSASFASPAFAAESVFYPNFALFVLLESAEILGLCPIAPSECRSIPTCVYNSHAEGLNLRIKDINDNPGEFTEGDYEDAAAEADWMKLLSKSDSGSAICLGTKHNVRAAACQGPFAVHPEPVESMLSSAQDIYCYPSPLGTLIWTVCSDGRIDVSCLLDPIVPKFCKADSHRDGDANSHQILYLIDSVKLDAPIASASVVSGLGSDILVQTSAPSCYHLSLLPVVEALRAGGAISGLRAERLGGKVSNPCGWLNEADVEGSITIVDSSFKTERLLVPFTPSTPCTAASTSSSPLALVIPPNPAIDLQHLLDAVAVFRTAVRSLSSLSTRFEEGKLSVADLQIIHSQMVILTDSIIDRLVQEVGKLHDRASLLSRLAATHHSKLNQIETLGMQTAQAPSIKPLLDRQESLKERAVRLLGRIADTSTSSTDTVTILEDLLRKASRIGKTEVETSIESALRLHSALINAMKRRLQ